MGNSVKEYKIKGFWVVDEKEIVTIPIDEYVFLKCVDKSEHFKLSEKVLKTDDETGEILVTINNDLVLKEIHSKVHDPEGLVEYICLYALSLEGNKE